MLPACRSVGLSVTFFLSLALSPSLSLYSFVFASDPAAAAAAASASDVVADADEGPVLSRFCAYEMCVFHMMRLILPRSFPTLRKEIVVSLLFVCLVFSLSHSSSLCLAHLTLPPPLSPSASSDNNPQAPPINKHTQTHMHAHTSTHTHKCTDMQRETLMDKEARREM